MVPSALLYVVKDLGLPGEFARPVVVRGKRVRIQVRRYVAGDPRIGIVKPRNSSTDDRDARARKRSRMHALFEPTVKYWKAVYRLIITTVGVIAYLLTVFVSSWVQVVRFSKKRRRFPMYINKTMCHQLGAKCV